MNRIMNAQYWKLPRIAGTQSLTSFMTWNVASFMTYILISTLAISMTDIPVSETTKLV